MPLLNTSGNVTADAYAGGVAVKPKYIEDYFSTWLRTGTGASATITTGLDASINKALVWTKSRSAATDHKLTDTVRGATKALISNTTGAQTTNTNGLTAFSSTGYTIGTDTNYNNNGATYVDWEFAATPKFFDVVTYTGDGTTTRNIAHNLGAEPGFIIVKRTDITSSWVVSHRFDSGQATVGLLNSSDAFGTSTSLANGYPICSFSSESVFYVEGGTTVNAVNASGGTYVAYLFAHDAGGFGLTGTDNVISCGSYTGNGSATGPVVTLGYEPQWLLVKDASSSSFSWILIDNMRNFNLITNATLSSNTSGAEGSAVFFAPTSTGFNVKSTSGAVNASGETYIYIAIRRGPMAVPTDATKVFGLSARSGTGANATVTGGQTDDAVLVKNRGSAVASLFSSRLTGTGYVVTSSTAAEVAAGTTILQASPWDVMDGVKVGTTSTITNASGNTFINYLFKRAPSVFDVVCYTGTGGNLNLTHNLNAIPEIIIIKNRSAAGTAWTIYLNAFGPTKVIDLTTTPIYDATSNNVWNNTSPTSTQFTIGTYGDINTSGQNCIAYLFATCAGVSKVGSYTGNGSTQTIDCGLTAGARFVLIKRTDASGAWYVYDTARGMTTLTDPYWLANTTAAEVATLGSVTTVSTGFALNSTILAAINVSGGTYIFLAIA